MNKINAFILLIIIGLLSCSNDSSRLNPEKQILRKWELNMYHKDDKFMLIAGK